MISSAERMLIQSAASGDAGALRRLVLDHQSAVRGFLTRALKGDSAKADDLAQEVFLLAYRNLKNFRFESSIATWLHRIAYNAYLDDRRRKKITPVEEATEETAVNPAPTDLRKDLEKALNRLREEERMSVLLTVIEEWTHEEAAEFMQIPLGTLKSHALRGKKNLAEQLSAMGWEVTP